MRRPGRSAVPCTLGLGVFGIVYLHEPLPTVSGVVSQTPLVAASCPLPVGRQAKAARAWGEMMPVFRHPRCANCHGAFDIRSDKHAGSDFAKSSELDPRVRLTLDQRRALHEGCDNCHGNIRGTAKRLDGSELSGWMVAPEPMLWDGKSDEQVCTDMKALERTGDQFVDHIENDHQEIQFIEAAFRGDLALGPEDVRKYLGGKPQPPPGTQADLVAKARKWVDLVGEGYTASPECGCVMPKIRLQIRHRSADDPNHLTTRMGEVGFAGDAAFEVTLTPLATEGADEAPTMWYEGRKSLDRSLHVIFANPSCRGTASQREDWVFTAEVDAASNVMKLQFGFMPSDEVGEAVCTGGGVVDRTELDPLLFADLEEMEVPLEEGATTWATTRDLGGLERGQEWMQVKVLGVPAEGGQ